MKKMFLASSFKDVAHLLQDFADDDLHGKTVTFIPTASIPETIKFYVSSGKKALEKLGIKVDELELSKAGNIEISEKLLKSDYIYISGGNTFYLLQELKRTGADKIIYDQINSGKLYIGESAGAMIVSPNIEYATSMDNHKKAPDLDNYSALAVVDFYPLPHYNNFPFKKTVEKIVLNYENKLKLITISNSQVILVNEESITVKNKQ